MENGHYISSRRGHREWHAIRNYGHNPCRLPMTGNMPPVHPHVPKPQLFDASQSFLQAPVARKYQPHREGAQYGYASKGLQSANSWYDRTGEYSLNYPPQKKSTMIVAIRGMWILGIKTIFATTRGGSARSSSSTTPEMKVATTSVSTRRLEEGDARDNEKGPLQ